jgi:hypothetical protein
MHVDPDHALLVTSALPFVTFFFQESWELQTTTRTSLGTIVDWEASACKTMRQDVCCLVCILYKWDYKMLLVVKNLLENPSLKSFVFFFFFLTCSWEVSKGSLSHKLCSKESSWGKDRLGSLYKNYDLVFYSFFFFFVIKVWERRQGYN